VIIVENSLYEQDLQGAILTRKQIKELSSVTVFTKELGKRQLKQYNISLSTSFTPSDDLGYFQAVRSFICATRE
jgi:hypothetical protein